VSLSKEEAPVTKSSPTPVDFDPALDSETYVKAREIAPGLDIYGLEAEWKDSVAQAGKAPRDPDGAFLKFCGEKAKQLDLVCPTCQRQDQDAEFDD
jgi:hypothetical protein